MKLLGDKVTIIHNGKLTEGIIYDKLDVTGGEMLYWLTLTDGSMKKGEYLLCQESDFVRNESQRLECDCGAKKVNSPRHSSWCSVEKK